MAQKFSLRYTLIEGQGNFGSVDGDAAAAMRYTEIKLSKISHEILMDLEKDTVDYISNYDDTEYMPEIMPTKIPNLLLNGSSGIAVGMATNIPPHNIEEVVNACLAYLENKHISVLDLMQHLPGPDFPTHGIIYGSEGILNAYTSGRGKIYIRAATKIVADNRTGKESIIIYEIPYQVNKIRLIEKIADLVKEKRIEGINALRDESDREGMRIVIEIKRDTVGEIVLNNLYSLTPLQVSFGINMVALHHEYKNLTKKSHYLKQILKYPNKLVDEIRKELISLKEEYKDSRRTKIIQEPLNINIEDLINKKDVVVTLSHQGYVKYQPLKDYEAQRRGGKVAEEYIG
uniref:Topo IIA-type catalytic domain-containing protein n=1 Tax=Glossina pallidipes TaxID=7398 RepID=A0A1A9Z1G2_GLOPL